ncbi:MAG: alpha-2-macroglobulin [Gammaproteobacteria bacterium]|nr:alpha-2-macroglobulin [Gammaproteobacteria bacterium]
MRLMALCAKLVGEFSWVPPAWLQRIGVRRAGWSLLLLIAAVALGIGAFLYYQSLPKPPRVVIEVSAPGITPIVNYELKPDPLRLDFQYSRDDSVPALLPPLSAARIDLVGETLGEGVEMHPAMAGEWRFETENRLVFLPADDWPANRDYHVRLPPDLFAPGLELAETEATFSTPTFTATVKTAEFYQHPEVSEERRVVASFDFSHPVSRADFEQRLGMSMREASSDGQPSEAGEARSLDLEVEYGIHDRSAHVHSGIVSIPERENFATVALARGLTPANGNGDFDADLSVQVRVPDRESYFRIRSIGASMVDDADDMPVQTAVVAFSDHVNTEDFADRVRAWVLPRDHRIGTVTYERYAWQSPRQVTPAVLDASEPLELTVNPTQRDAAMMQSVAFDAPAGRHVYLHVRAGLTSEGGFVMGSDRDDVVRAPDYPREAEIAQDGAVLPLTGNRLLTLSARGVKAIKVEIQQLLPGALNHLASQTRGDIRDPYFTGYSFDADNLSKLTTRIIDVNSRHPRERVFTTLDLSRYLPGGGLFFVKVQGWDRGRERTVGRSDRRMALVSDLGLLVKTNVDQSQHVFVHSIATGDPVPGARVDLLGKNGLPVRTGITDARGHVHLSSAAKLERDREPTVFVLRNGDDTTFMPYRRHDRRLTWSGFDIGGEHAGADDAERLKAAVYTDRGLYRPGEDVHLFSIVRQGDFTAVPGAPLELRITDARGARVSSRRVKLPADGLLDWDFATRPESPTGKYHANVFLVDQNDQLRGLGNTSFSVEDYQPDRLRIRTAIFERGPSDATRERSERSWLQPGTHFAQVELENLFGTPASARRVRGTLEIRPISPRFREHPEFVFTDPFRDPDSTPRSVTLELGETLTDENGVANLEFDIGQYDNGIYQLLLTTEGFEPGGGRGVKAMAGTLLSPADALVGYKADGDLDFIARDGQRTVRFLAIDRDLDPVSIDSVEAVLYERRFVSALVQQLNGTYAYQSVEKEDELERTPFELPATGVDHPLPTARAGRYALELVSADGGKLSRVEFAVAGAANLAGNLERDAELDLKLDRREYRPGDEILLEITAPYAGTGLVTIERDRVHAFEWFRSDTNTALARIRVPDGIEGNAYVNVAFVRDFDSEEIFVSPLSYAVAPFVIDRARRLLDIRLDVPDKVRPGDSLVVRHATASPARLVLFAVDEGILQVAKYQTPDPLETFLRKKALQVETHQMVDLILPDYAVVRRARAPGGGDLARLLGANLNPFRRKSEPPVAFWMGVTESGLEPRETSLVLPDYFNGELRVMAVGVGDERLGGRSVPVTVRAPLVVTPNLPVAVAPGDVFDLSVGIANQVEDSGADAKIAVAVADFERLTAEVDTAVTLAVAEGGEGRATFRLRAGASPGAASLTVTARLGEETTARGTSLSVRPAVPFETTVRSGFDADGDVRVELPRRLHEPFADRRIAASASPLVLADGLLEYLEEFPHACAEQIVSKVFPQLGLLRYPAFGLDRIAYEARFDEMLTLLRGRQSADGGFRFWATSTEAQPFSSVYITHFLADAREQRMAVPEDMLSRARGYLQRLAGTTPGESATEPDLADARTRAYAIYVLTRAGVVTTNYLNALQESLQRTFEDTWRSDIAAAYMAASHALLRNDTLAEGLIKGYRPGASNGPDTDFDTRLGRDAQYVYLLARHFPNRMARFDGAQVQQLVEPLFENRFNTLSAAYTILALGEIHRVLEQQGALESPLMVAGDKDGSIDINAAKGAIVRASLPVAVDHVDIETREGGVYFSASQSGFDAEFPTTRLAEGLEIDRVYLDTEGDPIDRVRVGDELTVRLRVRSQDGWIRNVAVTDLLPGGFEIIRESVTDRLDRWTLDYRDVRDDRLVIYASFGETLTEFRYRVKATSPGEFVVPAAYASAMYHRSVRGHSTPGRITVEGT